MAGNTVQFGAYQQLAERARLNIRLGTALRMEAEYRKISEKYDGHEEAALADDIDRLSGKAMNVADYLTRVEYGMKRIGDVRSELITMRTNLDAGAAEAFDYNFSTINSYAGQGIDQPDSLIANPGNGRGQWLQPVDQVDGGRGMVVSVDHKFIGNDYAIELDTGKLLSPNRKTSAMEDDSGLSLSFAKLSVTSFDTATDAVTFHYDDGSPTGVDYTGTVKRGGGSVLNAWLYNNFATQADKDRAVLDISEAHRRLAKAEQSLLADESGLQAARILMKSQVDELNTQYQKVSEENLTAKQAERKAAKARFDLLNNSLALTQGNSTVLIQQLFMTDRSISKPSMTDIMYKAFGY